MKINVETFSQKEYYNYLCSINDVLEEEQYGVYKKLEEIRKLLDWLFDQIETEEE